TVPLLALDVYHARAPSGLNPVFGAGDALSKPFFRHGEEGTVGGYYIHGDGLVPFPQAYALDAVRYPAHGPYVLFLEPDSHALFRCHHHFLTGVEGEHIHEA